MPITLTFKALADPTRRRILELLGQKNMTAGEISDQFHISKPSISHHLSLLKQAELVVDERQGQTILYSLNTSVMEEVLRWLLKMRERSSKK